MQMVPTASAPISLGRAAERNKKLALVALVFVVAIILAVTTGVFVAKTSLAAQTRSAQTQAAQTQAAQTQAAQTQALIEIKRGVSTPMYTPGVIAINPGPTTPGFWPDPEVSDRRLKLTTDGSSGNYCVYPQMTIDFTKGLTILVAFRFNKNGSWQRVLDLGNGQWDLKNNIVLCQRAQSPTLKFTIANEQAPDGQKFGGESVESFMQIGRAYMAIALYDPVKNRISLEVRDLDNVGVKGTVNDVVLNFVPSPVSTLTKNYIGMSNQNFGNSFSNLDIFSMLVSNTLFTDSQVESAIPRIYN